MLKSEMEFFDVAFPMNLGPLTYKGPAELRPGMLVRAEVKNTLKTGLILKKTTAMPEKQVKEIACALAGEPLLSDAMLRLIRWMSDYYFAKEGSVIKSIFPREFFDKVRQRGKAQKTPEFQKIPYKKVRIDISLTDEVKRHIEKKAYKTFLLRCPSTSYEISALTEVIKGGSNIIILVPEISGAEHLYGLLREMFGQRVSLLHSGMGRGAVSDSLTRIILGDADIVAGSRQAVFAPLKRPSLIVALNEESPHYKEEGGVRYNARDMAVLRGFIEGIPVLLSSICPSVESYHNAKKGKYKLLMPDIQTGKPKISIINMRYAKKKTPYLSKSLMEAATRRIKKGEKVMFLINRKGYSMLGCLDCGSVEMCGNCHIPLIFHKKEKALRCHYCGRSERAPDFCRGCKGTNLALTGAGIERAAEDIRRLTGENPVIIQKGSKEFRGSQSIIIGTKTIAKRPELAEFSLAGVINADSYLYIPDFRSREKAAQELFYIAGKAGQLLIQTMQPRSGFIEHIKNFDYENFYEDELGERKTLRYPPFSKLALIRMPALPEGIGEMLGRASSPEVEVLGPAPSITKRGKRQWKALLKSQSSEALQRALKSLLNSLNSLDKGKAKIIIDVDPVEI